MTPLAERAAIVAEAICPATHGARVCPACWAEGDRLAEEQARQKAMPREQLDMWNDGKAVVGGE